MRAADEWAWVVKLRSRFTGQEITLGARYGTREEAEIAGKDACARCNYISVAPVLKDQPGPPDGGPGHDLVGRP